MHRVRIFDARAQRTLLEGDAECTAEELAAAIARGDATAVDAAFVGGMVPPAMPAPPPNAAVASAPSQAPRTKERKAS